MAEGVYQFRAQIEPGALTPIRKAKRSNASVDESPRSILGDLVGNKVSCSSNHVLSLTTSGQMASPFGRAANPKASPFKSPSLRKSPKRKKPRKSSIGRRVSFSAQPDEVRNCSCCCSSVV